MVLGNTMSESWWDDFHNVEDTQRIRIRKSRKLPIVVTLLITIGIGAFVADALFTPVHNPMVSSQGN
jgi:hypothetical protein